MIKEKEGRLSTKKRVEQGKNKEEKKRFAPYWDYDPKKYENKTVEVPKTRVAKDYIHENESRTK